VIVDSAIYVDGKRVEVQGSLDEMYEECQAAKGIAWIGLFKPTTGELELAWVFHSGIFYYGVRKYIYESPVLEDKQQMINDAVDAFLKNLPKGDKLSLVIPPPSASMTHEAP